MHYEGQALRERDEEAKFPAGPSQRWLHPLKNACRMIRSTPKAKRAHPVNFE